MPGTRKTVRTMCPMNCHPTLCGQLAEVEDGKLVKVSGDPENPDSQGFLCVRGKATQEILGNSQRVLHPMIRDRRGTETWRRATWDEALDRIVSRMRAAGREAVGLWPGHGALATSYGTRIGGHLLARLANFYGCQSWSPAMVCWGLGGFGLGLTGVLETNTKEDMGRHSRTVILWGANLASQPNTSRHLIAAKRRGAHVATIDVRRTGSAGQSDETLILRPGTDTALALAMMHVIIAEDLHDRAFVAAHTAGFEQLAAHVKPFTPAWAAGVTGLPAESIAALARRYATAKPAMIVLGGSSLHKGPNGWQAARAVACLPALTGNLGVAGGGLGPRHGSGAHGRGFAEITEAHRRPPGTYIPNQMAAITGALEAGRIQVLMLFGTNMLSSYADAEAVARGLGRTGLVVSFDLFMTDTARRFADVVLPATAWLEELGCKATHTHLYLMEPALEPAGEARSLYWLTQALAQRLGLPGFWPWASEEGMMDALFDHPATGRITVAKLRAQGGMGAMNISHVAYPNHRYDTPSGRVEFYSERAKVLGLPPLPVHTDAAPGEFPLTLTHGRTLTHFHGFYDHGRALPTLAKHDSGPVLWIAREDAAARKLEDGAAIRIFNGRGALHAHAYVTHRIPPGVVWMRDGWEGLNTLTSGAPLLPDGAVDVFGFSAGQASYAAQVDVSSA